MKKTILLTVLLFASLQIFSQNNNSSRGNIQVVLTESSRTFVIEYPNYEEFRKKLMLSWGKPDVISAGSLIWNSISISGIGNQLKVVVSDGIETTESSGTTYKVFPDESAKFEILKDLRTNQKRKLQLNIENQQGNNIITDLTSENAVLNTLNYIISSVW